MLTLNGKDVTLKRRAPLVLNGGSVVDYNGGLAILTGRDIYNTVINGAEIPPPDNGCALYYPGLPAQGTTITDYSGLGNQGIIYGATWVRLPSGLPYLSYDGLDDYTLVGNAASLQIQTGTWLTWIKWTESVAAGTPDFIMAFGAGGYAFYVYRTGTAASERKLAFGKNGISETKATLTITDSNPHLVGVAYDGVNAVFFKDLTTNSQAYAAPTFTFATTLGVGGSGVGASPFKGVIILPRILSTVLTSAQMANIYNQERHLFGV